MSNPIQLPLTPIPQNGSLQYPLANPAPNAGSLSAGWDTHTVTVHNGSSSEQQTIAQQTTTHQTATQVFKACFKRPCTRCRVICFGGAVIITAAILVLDATWLHTLGFAKAVGL